MLYRGTWGDRRKHKEGCCLCRIKMLNIIYNPTNKRNTASLGLPICTQLKYIEGIAIFQDNFQCLNWC